LRAIRRRKEPSFVEWHETLGAFAFRQSEDVHHASVNRVGEHPGSRHQLFSNSVNQDHALRLTRGGRVRTIAQRVAGSSGVAMRWISLHAKTITPWGAIVRAFGV